MDAQFESLFSRLDNGKRIGNPAVIRSGWCREVETVDWDGRTANKYQVYSEFRAKGMSPVDAMAKANNEIK